MATASARVPAKRIRTGLAGVDTVSFLWQPDEEELWRGLTASCRFGQLPSGADVRRRGFGSFTFTDADSGVRWYIDPPNTTIYCEGRMAPMLGADPAHDTLAAFDRLGEAARRQAERFTDLAADHFVTGSEPPGYVTRLDASLSPVPQGREFRESVASQPRRLQRLYLEPEFDLAPHPASLRRLDLASELRFADPADGLAALRALAAVARSTPKANCWSANGRDETVSFCRGKTRTRIWFRAYDSGVKRRIEGRGTDPPGARLRFERQHVWTGGRRPRVAAILARDPAQLWGDDLGRLVPLDSRAIEVMDAEAAARELARLAESGTIPPVAAERLAGFVAIASQRGADWWTQLGRAQVGYRRRSDLRKHGLILAGSRSRPVDKELSQRIETKPLPIRAVLAAARGAWKAAERRRAARGA